MVVVEAVELGIRVEMAVMGEVDVREVDMRAEMVVLFHNVFFQIHLTVFIYIAAA